MAQGYLQAVVITVLYAGKLWLGARLSLTFLSGIEVMVIP